MNKQLITSDSIVINQKCSLTEDFDKYLNALYSSNNNLSTFSQPDVFEPILSVEDLINSSNDILADTRSLEEKNRKLKQDQCPIYKQPKANLPEIPGIPYPPIPPLPNLGFLQMLNVPIPALVAMFGGVGKVAIKASTDYAASQLKDKLINMSQGYECVVDAANKLYITVKNVSDMQYLMAQPVITPMGPGMVLPI